MAAKMANLNSHQNSAGQRDHLGGRELARVVLVRAPVRAAILQTEFCGRQQNSLSGPQWFSVNPQKDNFGARVHQLLFSKPVFLFHHM
jgi:hypothetical protein